MEAAGFLDRLGGFEMWVLVSLSWSCCNILCLLITLSGVLCPFPPPHLHSTLLPFGAVLIFLDGSRDSFGCQRDELAVLLQWHRLS